MTHRFGVLALRLASLLASPAAFSQCAGCGADHNRADRSERHDRPERASTPANADAAAKGAAPAEVRNMSGLTLSKAELQAREHAANAKTNGAFHEEASATLQGMAAEAAKKETAIAEKVKAQDSAMAIDESKAFTAAKDSTAKMVGKTDILPGVGDNPISAAKDAAELAKNTSTVLGNFDQVKAHREAQNREVDGTAQDDRNDLRNATRNREGLERLAQEQGEAAKAEHAKAEKAEAEAKAAADAAEARDRAEAAKAKADRDKGAARPDQATPVQ